MGLKSRYLRFFVCILLTDAFILFCLAVDIILRLHENIDNYVFIRLVGFIIVLIFYQPQAKLF